MRYIQALQLREERIRERAIAKAKKRAAKGAPTAQKMAAPPENKMAASPANKSLADWPLKMAPSTYLRLHPTGQHAALAAEIVGADA